MRAISSFVLAPVLAADRVAGVAKVVEAEGLQADSAVAPAGQRDVPVGAYATCSPFGPQKSRNHQPPTSEKRHQDGHAAKGTMTSGIATLRRHRGPILGGPMMRVPFDQFRAAARQHSMSTGSLRSILIRRVSAASSPSRSVVLVSEREQASGNRGSTVSAIKRTYLGPWPPGAPGLRSAPAPFSTHGFLRISSSSTTVARIVRSSR